MRKMFSVLHYEFKMQFKRLVTWGVLLVSTALSLHSWLKWISLSIVVLYSPKISFLS